MRSPSLTSNHQLRIAGTPTRPRVRRAALPSGSIAVAGDEHEVADAGRLAVAKEESLDVGAAGTEPADAPSLVDVLVGVEAADQPRAIRVDLLLEDVDPDRGARYRSAVHVDHRDLGGEVAIARGTQESGCETDEPARWPERRRRRDGLEVAVRIAVLELGAADLLASLSDRQPAKSRSRRARGVEDEASSTSGRASPSPVSSSVRIRAYTPCRTPPLANVNPSSPRVPARRPIQRLPTKRDRQPRSCAACEVLQPGRRPASRSEQPARRREAGGSRASTEHETPGTRNSPASHSCWSRASTIS